MLHVTWPGYPDHQRLSQWIPGKVPGEDHSSRFPVGMCWFLFSIFVYLSTPDFGFVPLKANSWFLKSGKCKFFYKQTFEILWNGNPDFLDLSISSTFPLVYPWSLGFSDIGEANAAFWHGLWQMRWIFYCCTNGVRLARCYSVEVMGGVTRGRGMLCFKPWGTFEQRYLLVFRCKWMKFAEQPFQGGGKSSLAPQLHIKKTIPLPKCTSPQHSHLNVLVRVGQTVQPWECWRTDRQMDAIECFPLLCGWY